MSAVIFFTIPLVVIAWLIFYLKRSWSYWEKRGVKVPPITFPYGHAKSYMTQKKSLHVMYQDFYNEHKTRKLKYGGFYFSTNPILILTDLDLIRQVLVKDFASFTDRPTYVNEEADPLSGVTFNLKGQRWKSSRAKISETYTMEKMKIVFDGFEKHMDEFKALMNEYADSKLPVDIKDVCARFTMDTIGTTGFGVECNGLLMKDSDFRKYALKGFSRDIFGARMFPKDVNDFFIKLVGDIVKHREMNNITKKDLMQLLIELRNKTSVTDKQMTINEMAAQAYGFFNAGFDTASTALTFCFFELSRNPQIQEDLRTEIRSVLQKYDSKVTYSAISEMAYLDKCVSETLRMYPPTGILIRMCTQAYKFPGTNLTIEKGTQIRLPLLAIHYDPEHHPDPYKFDPERFSPENKASRHPSSWIPFGEGPRNCLGMRFGLLQVKMGLVALLSNYRFSLNDKTILPITFNPKTLSLKSEHDIWLNVEKC